MRKCHKACKTDCPCGARGTVMCDLPKKGIMERGYRLHEPTLETVLLENLVARMIIKNGIIGALLENQESEDLRGKPVDGTSPDGYCILMTWHILGVQ